MLMISSHFGPKRRSGYVLLMCLLVIAVSSAIVTTLFNLMRLQTLEYGARRQQAKCQSLITAGCEHAISILIDNPLYAGSFGPVYDPVDRDNYYLVTVQNTGDPQVTVQGNAQITPFTSTFQLTASALSDRRTVLGL